jgi:hypothetical protein
MKQPKHPPVAYVEWVDSANVNNGWENGLPNGLRLVYCAPRWALVLRCPTSRLGPVTWLAS